MIKNLFLGKNSKIKQTEKEVFKNVNLDKGTIKKFQKKYLSGKVKDDELNDILSDYEGFF
ncbi:hypothetical protein SAMN02746089_02111 [Caldanaerobius fijiensis DSM 17918]|uniref:Uncharacterized protein n=1 Tax=Caldanaerobius fijiensis DSM 17918 TaxID=1121256 RepID=A0A1M5CFZ2_9THEO|nr:hypothetical protein SAMN02746089_02111 [Caldanaerobius fijiensis DSM 17918]